MAASARKQQHAQKLMTLMTMVGTAGGKRVACSRAEEALGVDLSELVALVDEIAALSVRESGAHAAVAVEDGFVVYRGMFDLLPAMRLSAGESLALAAALDDLGLGEALAEKISGALFGQGAEAAAEKRAAAVAGTGGASFTARLIEASDVGVRCCIRYQGQRDAAPRKRLIDPHEVVETDDAAYLVAWDCEKDAQRLFRIDRIAALEETDASVERHPYAPHSIDESLAGAETVAEVRFRSSRAFAEANWPGVLRTAPANAGGVIAFVPCANETWLFDQLLAAPADRVLQAPRALQQRFTAYAQTLLVTPGDKSAERPPQQPSR